MMPPSNNQTLEKVDDILKSNKTNIVAISANEVDRMLFKKGLSSPCMVKTEKNETIRRNWANRKIIEKTSKLGNTSSFMMTK